MKFPINSSSINNNASQFENQSNCKIVVFVNFLGVDLKTNLGVTKYITSLILTLKDEITWIAIADSVEDFKASVQYLDTQHILECVVSKGEAKLYGPKLQRPKIELLIHQFKLQILQMPSLIICHDLHIYDVPWKYNDIEKVKNNFKLAICSATVVACHFPRTYFSLERTAGITVKNLYLTPSIPMHEKLSLNQEVLEEVSRSMNISLKGERVSFLFPAQLQAHKGHKVLIHAINKYKSELYNIDFWFPGSDHSQEQTESLRDLIQQSNVDERVRLFGRVSEVELAVLYSACTAVVVPSLAEGGAYVPLEAISYGKAVAVNKIEQAEMHLTSHKANVLWFNSNDMKSVCNALIKLSSEKFRKTIIEKNKKINLNGYSSPKEQVHIRNIWNSLIGFTAGEKSKPKLGIDSNYQITHCNGG